MTRQQSAAMLSLMTIVFALLGLAGIFFYLAEGANSLSIAAAFVALAAATLLLARKRAGVD